MRIVYTNGCFSPIHIGHIDLLNYCHHLAGENGQLVIGLNTDSWIRKNKPKKFTIHYKKRYMDLRCLYPTSRIVPISFEEQIEKDLNDYIADNNEVFLVKGNDYKHSNITGANIQNVKLVLVPVTMWNSDFKISSSCNHKILAEEQMQEKTVVMVVPRKEFYKFGGKFLAFTNDHGIYFTPYNNPGLKWEK